ncbi:MAG: translation initiation factor IF-3 [Chlamydiia bacterium]|nr:translation initiation factor IF-3 [Chlamydiia bacterium]
MSSLKTNKQINENTVLLIDDEGTKLGIVSKQDALDLAKKKSLDLVEVQPSKDGTPSVCKLLDYGRFKFKSAISHKENKRKHSATTKLKNIRLSIEISENDLSTKKLQAAKWVDKKYSVRVFCILRGASIMRKGEAKELLRRFVEDLCEAKMDSPISANGRTLSCVMVAS